MHVDEVCNCVQNTHNKHVRQHTTAYIRIHLHWALKMNKTAAISLRVPAEVKEAVERAAKDDERTVAAYVQRLLVQHLRATGYLTK